MLEIDKKKNSYGDTIIYSEIEVCKSTRCYTYSESGKGDSYKNEILQIWCN